MNLSQTLGIARSLAMELMPEQRHGAHAVSQDAGAYQAYLKARFHWNKPGDEGDRKSTRLNSSHSQQSRMPSSA